MAEVRNEKKNLPKNRLLYLFVQHVWDPRHGPCYDGQEYQKLENSLKTIEYEWSDWKKHMIFRNSEGSPFCTSRKPISIISYEDFQHKKQKSRDMIILAHVAYQLRSLIKFLNTGKADVNYKNCDRRVVLDAYLHDCRDLPADAPEDQISICRKVIESLIEMGAQLITASRYRDTPFYIATSCKNYKILQILISCLYNVEERDKFGNTALHIVVDNCIDKEGNHRDGYVDLVRTLVSKGANANARNEDGVTAVHLAAEKFQPEMLRLFADQDANFGERTNNDETPLQCMCKSSVALKDSSKIIETFDFLVSQGCDVGTMDNEGYTLLHKAAEFQIVEIVEKFIALGATVDCQTKSTLLTPLYLAAKSDKLDNMKALVKAGADVNAEAADGSTPIFMSAMLGSYESMQFLMDKGAELNRRDSLMRFTLLHMAANDVNLRPKSRYNTKVGERQNITFKKFGMLIDKALDVNDESYCGITPLQLAIMGPNLDAVKLLLDYGADANFRNRWTALELAIEICDHVLVRLATWDTSGPIMIPRIGHKRRIHVGVYPEAVEKDDVRLSCPITKLWSCDRRRFIPEYLELVTMLIENGADVNYQNAEGKTPLHLVWQHKDKAMEVLLDAGAHVNVQDGKGSVPVHRACNDTFLKLLLDHGADVNDDDTSRILMKDLGELKNVAIKHVIRRKLVGLPIAKIYEPHVDSPKFAKFHEMCSKEATALINRRDGDGFSLYEFLRVNQKFQYKYIDKISRKYENLEELFPLYAGLIRGACRESAIRRQLLDSARIVWAENSGVYLPEVCVEHILSYLGNRYLEVMTTTVKETKIMSVPGENAVFEYLFRD